MLPSLDTIRDEDDADWRQDLVQTAVNENISVSPQIAESLLYLWRVTGEEKYRSWGWELFNAHMENASQRSVSYFESSGGTKNVGSFQSDLADNFLPVSIPIYIQDSWFQKPSNRDSLG